MECVIIKSGSDETLINGCSLHYIIIGHHLLCAPANLFNLLL